MRTRIKRIGCKVSFGMIIFELLEINIQIVRLSAFGDSFFLVCVHTLIIMCNNFELNLRRFAHFVIQPKSTCIKFCTKRKLNKKHWSVLQ